MSGEHLFENQVTIARNYCGRDMAIRAMPVVIGYVDYFSKHRMTYSHIAETIKIQTKARVKTERDNDLIKTVLDKTDPLYKEANSEKPFDADESFLPLTGFSEAAQVLAY